MNRLLNKSFAKKFFNAKSNIHRLSLPSRNNKHNSVYSFSSLASLLKPAQVDLINEQKVLFDTLYKNLSKLDVNPDVLDLVIDSKNKIDDLFMVVVVGEFNAGKSTFINALLGDKYLLEGVLPTTSKIGILRSSNNNNSTSTSSLPSLLIGSIDSANSSHIRSQWRRAENILLTDVEEIDVPLDWLQHIAIIDTPGTNAIITKHELLTQKIVPRADLVLFVTSAERPMTESESIFLSKISQWGKKVVMIINKMDTLETAEDKQKVVEYVSQNASKALGSSFHLSSSLGNTAAAASDTQSSFLFPSSSPSSSIHQQQLSSSLPIFAVSGKQGLIAKLINKNKEVNSLSKSSINTGTISNDDNNSNSESSGINILSMSPAAVLKSEQKSSTTKLWKSSNMDSVETYLKTVLGEQALIKNKILNPLTVADRIITDTLLLLDQRKKYLESDMRVIELIQENFLQFEQDLDRDLKYYQTQIKKLFSSFQSRVDRFLENNMSVTKYHVLWYNQELFLEQFKKEVLLDITVPLEQILIEVSELIATRCKNQAKAVMEYIGNRPQRIMTSTKQSQQQYQQQSQQYNQSGSSSSSHSTSASEMSRDRGDHASSRINSSGSSLRVGCNSNSSSNNNSSSISTSSSSGGMIGKIVYDNHFESTRVDMLYQLQKDITTIISTHYNQQEEIENMTKQISESYLHSGTIQGVSAISLGALLTFQMLDITGIAFLTTTALLSFILIPTKKKRLITSFHTKMILLQSHLDESILHCFQKGKIKGEQKILDNIAPYTRHVTVELKKMNDISIVMNELRNTVSNIQSRAQNIK